MLEDAPDIPARDGARETFVVHPDRGGRFPAVLFLMDAPGIRVELRDMARRLATVGYVVLLPNRYDRAGRDSAFGPDMLAAGSADHARMRAIRTRMTIPPVIDDVASMLAFVDARDDVRHGTAGVPGYCLGGPCALAAARFPDRVAAAASFCGTWLVSDAEESRHLTLAKSRGELCIACAEHDDLAPLPMVAELQKLFAAAGASGELEICPGVHHGFGFPQRRACDRPAAGKHRQRLIALSARNR